MTEARHTFTNPICVPGDMVRATSAVVGAGDEIIPLHNLNDWHLYDDRILNTLSPLLYHHSNWSVYSLSDIYMITYVVMHCIFTSVFSSEIPRSSNALYQLPHCCGLFWTSGFKWIAIVIFVYHRLSIIDYHPLLRCIQAAFLLVFVILKNTL